MATSPAQAQAIANAANKWHVPAWVLQGVYGLETSFGSNIKTSSAGAMGAFQFIPSTAAKYSYPLTNSPNDQQFAAQADAAAHYLSDLFHQYGSWDTALHAYSGGVGKPGTYGQKEVLAQNKIAVHGDPSKLHGTQALHAGENLIKKPLEWTGELATLLGNLLQPAFWLRALEIVAGLAIGVFGLKMLAATARDGSA